MEFPDLNDVLEVVKTDPDYMGSRQVDQEMVKMSGTRLMPYVKIIEQPASKALRFRYECEGRSAGSIPGVNSTPENKTFPTIKIMDYKGRAVVVVSCVTKDFPYRPHPHNLVGKEACKRGVCTVEISSDNMTVTFANLGIQCVKKKDIEEALKVREEIRVDPFQTGFSHKKQPTSIDLNAVRLCFQVFVEGTQKGKFNVPLKPVVSEPIFDKKAMSDLVICKLSHCSASVAGGMEMILLCEKVAKEDIKVKFYEEKDRQIVWEGFGDFQPSDVHKQTAIAFRTPSYHTQQIEQPVQVFIQLMRPTDGATSEPRLFQMLPLGSDDPDSLRRKRQKYNNSPIKTLVLKHVQKEAGQNHIVDSAMLSQPRYSLNVVKPEPRERSPYERSIPSPGSFSMYSVGSTSPQPQLNMQTLRPPASSPSRTPSPGDYTPYTPPLIQPQSSSQYPAAIANMSQEPSAVVNEQQQFSYLQDNLINFESGAASLQGIYNPGYLGREDGMIDNLENLQQYLSQLPESDNDTILSNNFLGGLFISDSTEASGNANMEMYGVEKSKTMTEF